MHRRVVGNFGLFIAIVLACFFCIVNYLFAPTPHATDNFGICFPSPNIWPIDSFVSAIFNLLLILLAGFLLVIFNKTYNLTNVYELILPASFFILYSTNPCIEPEISSSTLLIFANLTSLFILFKCYRSVSASKEIFIVGTILSIGSMFQYAFLLFIPIYFLICLILRCMNFKGFIALILGVAAPYWTGIGLGLIPIDSFKTPSFTHIYDVWGNQQTLFFCFINCGVTILITFLIALYNSVKLYSGNTRHRLFNRAIILLGAASAIMMVCDADNLPAYIPVLYLVTSVQLANLYTLHNLKYPRFLILILFILYTSSFIFMNYYSTNKDIDTVANILVDNDIPYIKGRLEPVSNVEYLDQFGFKPENVKNADALIIRTRTKCDSHLLSGSSVGLIATATIGTDQIDIPWCRNAGIDVTNSPGCNAPAVAQYVWSSLLRLGFNPSSQTLGVVGCGNVGSIVADWGRAMGANLLISDPPRQKRGIADNYVPLDQLMAESDAVTLHTPLTLDGENPTRHLIGSHELSLMKKNAILVNAARGPVVDSNALLPLLK